MLIFNLLKVNKMFNFIKMYKIARLYDYKSKIYQLPVVDENKKLLGLLRLHDLVSVGA